MKNRKKLRLKSFNFHPITTFIIMIIAVMILSFILSLLQVQASYSRVNASGELESVLVTVENVFNFEGFKYLLQRTLYHLLH